MNDKRPVEITIGDNKYYDADELRQYDPAYFYGCSRTARNILKKRAIDRINYVYATLNKKTGWSISADQNKPATKACLLLLSEWVIGNIPKMMPMSEESEESKESIYDYPEAPEIIILDDEEKFRDDENKIVEIEIRGERTSGGIYFLTADVSKVFEMPNLLRVIKDDDCSYIINEDYKIFVGKNSKKNAIRKQTYMTYLGLFRIIFGSHNPITKYNKLLLVSWLQNIVEILPLTNELYFQKFNQQIQFNGIVYFVTCDILNGIKIGFWRSSLIALKHRYTTSYGANTKILFCRTNNAPTLEQQIHTYFSHYNLSNEIFRKDKLYEYLEYMKNIKGLPIYDYDELNDAELFYKPQNY